ncbi:hypothetical protein Tco_1430592 [Tanacetum coccineum]
MNPLTQLADGTIQHIWATKDSDIEKEDVSSINVHEHDLGNMMRNKEEVKEKGKEEDEMETDEEVEEVF